MIRFIMQVGKVCYYEDKHGELRWVYCTRRDHKGNWVRPIDKIAVSLLK